MKPWLKRRKNLEFYETLLAELQLEDDIKFYLRMPSENFEQIFQLIKDDITKENTKMRKLIPPRLQLAATIGFLSTGELYKSCVYEYYSSYSTMNSSTCTSFRAFVFTIFFFSVNSLIFLEKLLIRKTNHLI